ncbi:MAG TPA: hypothetical protein VK473_04180 [Terriglobales bacterium]|nr:hypothetical protein [Terriglobales bacterium]
MARVIRFYIPRNFQPAARTSSRPKRARVIAFRRYPPGFVERREVKSLIALAKRMAKDISPGA